MISVVLADDHVVVRTGIKMLLDADPDIEVVAEAAEGTEAYSLVARYKPDVLLHARATAPGRARRCQRRQLYPPDHGRAIGETHGGRLKRPIHPTTVQP